MSPTGFANLTAKGVLEAKSNPCSQRLHLCILMARNFAVSKVLDLKPLMQFVPLVYQKFYLDIIDDHADEILKYRCQEKRGKVPAL